MTYLDRLADMICYSLVQICFGAERFDWRDWAHVAPVKRKPKDQKSDLAYEKRSAVRRRIYDGDTM